MINSVISYQFAGHVIHPSGLCGVSGKRDGVAQTLVFFHVSGDEWHLDFIGKVNDVGDYQSVKNSLAHLRDGDLERDRHHVVDPWIGDLHHLQRVAQGRGLGPTLFQSPRRFLIGHTGINLEDLLMHVPHVRLATNSFWKGSIALRKSSMRSVKVGLLLEHGIDLDGIVWVILLLLRSCCLRSPHDCHVLKGGRVDFYHAVLKGPTAKRV